MRIRTKRSSQTYRFLLSLLVLWGTSANVSALGSQAAHPEIAGITESAPLDINTATAAELKALPGMGDAYVKRIIEGRPYTAKNQLVTRGVLPQTAYERIRDRIVAHRIARSQPQ